jgi:hypothetical protein
LLLALLVSGAAPALAGAATLTAEAGLGGMSRPGRWTPVRVSVDASSADITGEIVLDWGSARARRAISLSAGSRKQFELYIRTPDVREAIVVRLASDGRDLASVEVPIRVARPEDALTLCVAAANAWPVTRGCSTTQSAARLPHSWRGYDAVDEVVWAAGAQPLQADQQIALAQWKAIHALEESGISPSVAVPQMPSPLSASARRAIVWVAGYVLAIAVAGFAFTRIRARSLTLYPAVGLLVVVGSAAALAAGRVGPGAEVRIQQSVVAEQLSDTGSALILSRGIAEFPSFGEFELRARGIDGAIGTSQARGRSWRYDEDGAPLMPSGIVGLGTRRSFELEAVVDFQALVASVQGRTVRVSNHSSHALDECRFPDGFSKERVGTLSPGQTVEAERLMAGDDASFTCTLAAPIVDYTVTNGDVRSESTAVVMLQLPSTNPCNPRNPCSPREGSER